MPTSVSVNTDIAAPRTRLGTVRQAIHGTTGSVVAFELLFRDGETTGDLSSSDAAERATAYVLADAFSGMNPAHAGDGLPLFVNLPRAFLVGDLPLPCPPDAVVLEILEDVVVDDALLAAVRSLREQGFSFAVDDYEGEAERLPLLALADYVKVDVRTVPVEDGSLAAVVATARREAPRARLVAERVEDPAEVPGLAALGFTLFQGFAFHRPAPVPGQSIDPSRGVALRLLARLAAGDAGPVDVEPLVSSDAALALRVLRAANSAAAGAAREVSSLRQALVLLGPSQLSAWVLLMLLGAGAGSSLTEMVTSLARAGACARLVPERRDEAFTVGLMSGVAEVLGLDLREVVEGTGLAGPVRAALLEHGGELGAALGTVMEHEKDGTPATPEVTRAVLAGLNEALALVRTTSA